MAASKGILLVFGIGAIFGPVSAGIFMQWLGPTGAFIYIAAVLGTFTVFGIIRIILGSAVPEAERTIFLPMNRTSQAALELDPRSSEESNQL